MIEIDGFSLHEALDRSYVAMDHFHEYVQTHPCIDQDPELNALAETALNSLMALYQKIAEKSL
jgi:hypothetical protein